MELCLVGATEVSEDTLIILTYVLRELMKVKFGQLQFELIWMQTSSFRVRLFQSYVGMCLLFVTSALPSGIISLHLVLGYLQSAQIRTNQKVPLQILQKHMLCARNGQSLNRALLQIQRLTNLLQGWLSVVGRRICMFVVLRYWEIKFSRDCTCKL